MLLVNLSAEVHGEVDNGVLGLLVSHLKSSKVSEHFLLDETLLRCLRVSQDDIIWNGHCKKLQRFLICRVAVMDDDP